MLGYGVASLALRAKQISPIPACRSSSASLTVRTITIFDAPFARATGRSGEGPEYINDRHGSGRPRSAFEKAINRKFHVKEATSRPALGVRSALFRGSSNTVIDGDTSVPMLKVIRSSPTTSGPRYVCRVSATMSARLGSGIVGLLIRTMWVQTASLGWARSNTTPASCGLVW